MFSSPCKMTYNILAECYHNMIIISLRQRNNVVGLIVSYPI